MEDDKRSEDSGQLMVDGAGGDWRSELRVEGGRRQAVWAGGQLTAGTGKNLLDVITSVDTLLAWSLN